MSSDLGMVKLFEYFHVIPDLRDHIASKDEYRSYYNNLRPMAQDMGQMGEQAKEKIGRASRTTCRR